jgi:UDP-glucose 4-epimerase
MIALITGATGFIGSVLTKELESIGYKIRIVSRNNHKDYDTVICNLGAEKVPESAFDSVDLVFHLAGYTHDINNNSNRDAIYQELNVNATVDLMKAAVKQKVSKFIFVSSVKAGGITNHSANMNEDNQLAPSDIYGKTKREAEVLILKMGKEYGIEVSIVRPALVYGVDMKGNLAFMFNGVKNGWFPPLPETHNMRSMISVIDLVKAIILVSKNKKTDQNIYIATDGNQYSSRDIFKAICIINGKKVPNWALPQIIFIMLARVGDIFKFLPFNSFRYHKLFGSESYSSGKLNEIGFIPKYDLTSYFQEYNTDR